MDKETQEKIAEIVGSQMKLYGNSFSQPDVKYPLWERTRDITKYILDAMEELGYRKPLDRPELTEKIDAALVDLINQYELVKQSNEPVALIATVRHNCLKDILQILALITPKDKPPLLSDEEINSAFDGAFDKEVYFDHKPAPEEIILIRLRAVAQAQRENR